MDYYPKTTEKGTLRVRGEKGSFSNFFKPYLKNMELEAALEETKKEAMCGGFAPRDKKDPSEWIPRGPERMTLNGHRSPITRVLFHPQFNLLVTSSEDSQIKV